MIKNNIGGVRRLEHILAVIIQLVLTLKILPLLAPILFSVKIG